MIIAAIVIASILGYMFIVSIVHGALSQHWGNKCAKCFDRATYSTSANCVDHEMLAGILGAIWPVAFPLWALTGGVVKFMQFGSNLGKKVTL